MLGSVEFIDLDMSVTNKIVEHVEFYYLQFGLFIYYQNIGPWLMRVTYIGSVQLLYH